MCLSYHTCPQVAIPIFVLPGKQDGKAGLRRRIRIPLLMLQLYKQGMKLFRGQPVKH